MLKKAVILSLAVLTLAACGQKPPEKELDIAAFAQQAVKAVDFGDEVVLLSENTTKDFYDLQFEGLEQFVVYTSGTRATASEVAVFKVTDKDAMSKAKEAVNARLDDQKESYENYRPDEMPKLNNALVKEEGNYLLFAVSPNNDAIAKLFADSLK